MRTYDEYHKILELWERGIPKKRIGIMLNIPRITVRDCIERYGSIKGLEEHKERASRSTPDEVLNRIQDPQNVDVQKAYAYVLGIYLGDGYIVLNSRGRVFYLRIALDERYPNLIQLCAHNIQALLPNNKVNVLHSKQGNFVEVLCTYKFWPAVFPQSGKGMKHTREIKLQDWQQCIVDTYPLEFVRGLYHSDGSRFSNIVYNRDYPRYQFTNTSQDIVHMFTHACDLLGVHWTQKQRKTKNAYTITDIFISKRPDVAFLDQHIGPKT